MMWRCLELWFDKILLSMCSLVYRNWLTDENKQQNNNILIKCSLKTSPDIQHNNGSNFIILRRLY